MWSSQYAISNKSMGLSNKSMGISKILKMAILAVQHACIVTNKVQANLEKIQQLQKNDKSPVTVADFAAQAVVTHVLASSLGSIKLVGEETSAELRETDQETLCLSVVKAVQTVWAEATKEQVLDAIDLGNHDASSSSYWTLDPIDGTKGFLRGGQYAISLALIENGEVILGVLGCPNLSLDFDRAFDQPDPDGVIYFAQRDEGAWRAVDGNSPQKITTGSYDGLIRVCESVESGHSKHDDTARIVEKLGGAGESAKLDSQCKYAVVARGQADAYLRLPTRADYVEKIWDHAGGMLIAQEAGMIVSDIYGESLDFSQGAGLKNNSGVICASPKFHAQILDAIEELGIAS
ncbi:MAG: 3'(2'),5'-bisphosphate nucleotidase [Gammaproteobacteria bacterium]